MIEVGMMVEIVYLNPSDVCANEVEKYLGHIGKVLRLWDIHPRWGKRWEIAGASPEDTVFKTNCLKPIIPPSDDISLTRANPITFDDMMNEFKELTV